MRSTMRISAGLSLALMLALIAAPGRAEEVVTPFPPPAQYTPNPAKPFETLLAADVKWVQTKITDRKRRRRFEENQVRLPNGDDKAPYKAAVEKLDGELKDVEAALAVLKAKQPDAAAQKQLVKAHVGEWIKALNEKAENLRKDAAEADEKAKKASRQFDIARAQADAWDDRQQADNADKEAKALADDLAAAGL